MNALIDQIFEEVTTQEAEERRKAEEELKERITQTRAKMVEFLTQPLYELLQPYAQEKVAQDRRNVVIRWDLPTIDELGLCPFSIHYPNGHYGDTFVFHSAHTNDPKDAIAYARKMYPEHKKKEREEAVKKRAGALRYYWANTDQGKVEMAHLELLTLAPERKGEWDSMMDKWMNDRDLDLRRQEEQRIEEEKRETENKVYRKTVRDYVGKLAAWIAVRDAVQPANQEKAKGIQEANNDPYTVYKLTYALVAQDEEELSRYLETREVYTLQGEPNPDGYWPVYGKPTRFFHPVSIERMEVRPTDEILARSIHRDGAEIHFPPSATDEYIEKAMEEIVPLPHKPALPSPLNSWDEDRYMSAARKLAYPDQADEYESEF